MIGLTFLAMLSLPNGPVVAQQPLSSAAVLNSFLEQTGFFLDADEPKAIIGSMQFAFPPTGAFATKLNISVNGNVLQTLTFRDNIAVKGGAFAEVRGRIPGAVSLGTEDGVRTFEFFVNEVLAGKFTFSLQKIKGGDPLNPKTSWKITGPWKDFGYFKHKPDDGTRQDVYFTYWVAQHELATGEKTVTATLKKGTSVVATSRDCIPNGSPYSRFEVPILKLNKDPLMVKDLAGLSGSYTLEVTAGKRVLRTWKVSIASGDFVANAKSDHLKTAPTLWLPSRVLAGTSVNPFVYYWVSP